MATRRQARRRPARRRRSFKLKGVSKRDFVAIANVLCVNDASNRVVRGLGGYFKSQNPRFDESRFEHAATTCSRSLSGPRRSRRRRRR